MEQEQNNARPDQPPGILPIQSKDMEVHAHGHVHEQKKWKEYVFQFIMLFLAVFLGFLAENLREKGVEKNIEHDYIQSLSVDLAYDSVLADINGTLISDQTKRLDTLQGFFLDISTNPNQDSLIRTCYTMSSHINTFYPEFFNERTISQLLSSGAMRLIKKQDVADSIMDYYSQIKFIDNQRQEYVNSMKAASAAMYNVYDITFLRSIQYLDKFYYRDLSAEKCQFLTTSSAEMKKFVAILENAKIMASGYKDYLGIIRDHSARLHDYLKKCYDLKD